MISKAWQYIKSLHLVAWSIYIHWDRFEISLLKMSDHTPHDFSFFYLSWAARMRSIGICGLILHFDGNLFSRKHYRCLTLRVGQRNSIDLFVDYGTDTRMPASAVAAVPMGIYQEEAIVMRPYVLIGPHWYGSDHTMDLILDKVSQ